MHLLRRLRDAWAGRTRPHGPCAVAMLETSLHERVATHAEPAIGGWSARAGVSPRGRSRPRTPLSETSRTARGRVRGSSVLPRTRAWLRHSDVHGGSVSPRRPGATSVQKEAADEHRPGGSSSLPCDNLPSHPMRMQGELQAGVPRSMMLVDTGNRANMDALVPLPDAYLLQNASASRAGEEFMSPVGLPSCQRWTPVDVAVHDGNPLASRTDSTGNPLTLPLASGHSNRAEHCATRRSHPSA
jgi:hypothetical protein